MATARAMYSGKLSIQGHTRNSTPCSRALSDHIRLGPKRSTSLPMGTATTKLAIAATVRPMPTWPSDRPTTRMKNTAEPARKAPSPEAKMSDCSDSRPARVDGGVA